jgi:transcriptional regulator
MYVPAHFAMSEGDTASMLTSITAADLITTGPDGLVATFLPLEYDPDSHSLLGHVARNNPHWKLAPAPESLVIARGPDAYVSPSWYASKAEHGRVVPTWNYTTLHVHGKLTVEEDIEWLRALVTRLTQRHEADLERPWEITDAPGNYIDGQLRAIVGLRLSISRIEAKLKASQNRSQADQDGVITALSTRGPAAKAMAAEMAEGRQAG